MKWSFLLFSSLLCLQAFAQYPATGNKARLGWQTTGDGLVYRGAIGDTTTLDPSGLNNAWMLLDTASGNLYAYRTKAWRLVSGGGGSVSDTLTGEVKGPLDSTYVDTVANIIFDITADTTAGVGELKYNDTQGSLMQGLKGGNVTNVIGQQLHQRVLNKTGSPLAKGEAVFLQGSQGNRITVAKAIATVDSTSANTFGIVAESIADNQSGYIITEGLITGLNTSALTEGAAVWLSPTVAGGLTTTKPQAPDHGVYIGVCVKQNNGSGELFVKIRNGQELEELHDVRITSPATNASLYYNTAQGIWRDTGAAVLVADTSAMLSPYLKKADTTSLSNRINLKLNISDTSVFARDFQISGTAGQVAYFNAANAVTSDTAFRWSAANKTLGINTSTTSGANIIIKNSQEPSRSTVVATQTFSADTTNWTRGTGWTFNGTAAVATAATGNLTYTPALTITSGNAYEVTYTISGYSAGLLRVVVGNTQYTLPTHNVTSNVVLLLPSASGIFQFTTLTFTGNLDNVSVVEISKPAPVVLAGQDDNSSALYGEMRYPNSSSIFIGDGGRFATAIGIVGFGEGAGFSHTAGISNVYFGYRAGYNNTNGGYNNFFGYNAGQANTIGSYNNFFGFQSGLNNTTGNFNNFFGRESGTSNITGTHNNYFGDLASQFATGSYNNAFGEQTLRYSSGSYNNAFGSRAGFANTTGVYNNFIGSNAGYSTTTGNGNNFIGVFSGENNTTGGSGITIGGNSGKWLRSGNGNIFIGNTSGPQVAADSLSGSNNIGIGQNAADNIRAAAAGNVAIGNQVDLPTSNGSNQGVYQNVLFFTGASGTGTTIAAGSRAGIKTNAPASDFHVAGEVRIDDLKPTGAPRNIVGSSSTGDLSTMAWGNGLTVSVGDTILRVDTSVILPKVNVSGTTNYLAKFTAGNRVGNSVLFEDTNGDIGAGTTDPTSFGNYRYIENTGRSLANGGVFQTTNSDKTLIGQFYTADGQARLATNTNHRLALLTNNTQRILIDTVGNVGIGVSSPVSRLHIDGLNDRSFLLHSDGSTYWYGMGVRSSEGLSLFSTDNFGILFGKYNSSGTWTENMRITSAGNVGIATASPSRPLHINATSAIRLPVGNFAERGTSGAGDIRVRNDTANLEFHNGTTWQTVATQSYVTDNAISTVYIPINLYAPGDTVANTTNSKAFFMVHSGLNGYCIDSYTVKAISGSGTADIQIDKNGTGGNLQAISGTTVATKDTNIALATGDYIRGQVFNLSGTLVGLGLTLEIKKTCN